MPKVFRATILDILGQIVARWKEGLLPVADVTAAGSSEAMELRHEETRAEAFVAPLSCVANSPVPGEQDAQDAAHGKPPIPQTGEDSESRVASLEYPRELPPHRSLLPRIEPRWREASRPPEGAEERSPLFDDIRASDWLASRPDTSSGATG